MKWTQEHYDYILSICNGKSSKEIHVLFNEHFNENITFYSLKNAMHKCGARTNFNSGRFQKGFEPFNKGLKWDDYVSKEGQENSRKTCFKKGHGVGSKNNKWVEVGTETVGKDGYILIKLNEKRGRKYTIPKSHYIWEQHFGKIPKGHKVIFLDGNKYNFDIDNLALVSNGENLRLNAEKLRIKGNKELTKCGITIVKIEERIKEYEKQTD